MCRRPFPPFPTNKHIQCSWHIIGPTVITLYLNVVHIYFWLRLSFFLWVMYQSNCQELLLCVLCWSEAVYKVRDLSNWSIILSVDARGILEALKILLVCIKFLLYASEHWQVCFPHRMVDLRVAVKLKHDSHWLALAFQYCLGRAWWLLIFYLLPSCIEYSQCTVHEGFLLPLSVSIQ